MWLHLLPNKATLFEELNIDLKNRIKIPNWCTIHTDVNRADILPKDIQHMIIFATATGEVN
jgi:hypothetical protein